MSVLKILFEAILETGASMLVVAAVTALCIKAAMRIHHAFAAALAMTAFLVVFVVSGLGSGNLRAMMLTFGCVAAAGLVLWAQNGKRPSAKGSTKGGGLRQGWHYPALIARIGEERQPTPAELRALLTRLRTEMQPSLPADPAACHEIKRVARRVTARRVTESPN